jgi:hypothetical protein
MFLSRKFQERERLALRIFRIEIGIGESAVYFASRNLLRMHMQEGPCRNLI